MCYGAPRCCRFVSSSTLEGPFFLCRSDQTKVAANLIQAFPLSMQRRCDLTLVRLGGEGRD